jgi:hypothetical protein
MCVFLCVSLCLCVLICLSLRDLWEIDDDLTLRPLFSKSLFFSLEKKKKSMTTLRSGLCSLKVFFFLCVSVRGYVCL